MADQNSRMKILWYTSKGIKNYESTCSCTLLYVFPRICHDPDRRIPGATAQISRTVSGGSAASQGDDSCGGGSKGVGKHAVLAHMLKAAGQRQHWKEAIVLFDTMQAEVHVPGCWLVLIVVVSATGLCVVEFGDVMAIYRCFRIQTPGESDHRNANLVGLESLYRNCVAGGRKRTTSVPILLTHN